MANKQIIIPVSFELDTAALQKISQNIATIASSSSKALSGGTKAQAQELYKNLLDAISLYNKQSGNMSAETEKEFQKMFSSIFKQIGVLGVNVRKELKNVKLVDILPDSVANKFKDLQERVAETKRELERLEAVNIADVKTFLAAEMPDSRFLGLEKYISYQTAINELIRQNTKLEELSKKEKDNKHLTPEEQAYLVWLRMTNEERQRVLPLLETQKTKSDANAKSIEESTAKLKLENNELQEQNKLLREQYLGKETKAGQGIQSPEKKSTPRTNDTGQAIAERIKKLGSEVSVFGSITNAVQGSFANLLQRIVSGQIIIAGFKRVMNETIRTVKDLDKAFNEIAMVTTYTTQEVWQMKDSFVAIAKSTGMALTEVTKLAGEFFKQGRSLSETLKLTEAAGVAAKIAGISASDSVNYLTSAINGYKLSADQAMVVSDKFAALAASSATDYEELAIALSKVAAQAYTAGVNMDNMMGFIAKALEVTREAPENIGTAFKTIFARMQELKDYGKTIEDGMDVNRVETALKTIGVDLIDQSNELRNLDDVLIDVGSRWSSLNKNQKAYVTTALAGTRQQTRLLAVFEDFDRTMKLAEISANSLGASLAQQSKYQDSISYAINNMRVAWQDFISSLVKSEFIIFIVNIMTGFVDALNAVVEALNFIGPVMTGVIVVGFILLGLMVKMNLASYAAAKAKGGEALANFFLAASNGTLSASFATLATSIQETWVAMGPAGWIIIGVTTAILGLAAAMGIAAKKNKDMLEGMKQAQADMYNYNKKANDLETLVEEYNKLNESVTKTNADLQKQQDLLKQIQDLVGDKFQVVGLNGDLQTALVTAEIEELRNKANQTFEDAKNKAIGTAGSIEEAYAVAIEGNDVASQQFLIIAKALEHAKEDGISTYNELINKEKTYTDLIMKRAKIELAAQVTNKKYKVTDRFGNEIGRFSDEMTAKRRSGQFAESKISVVYEIDEEKSKEVQAEASEFFDKLESRAFFTSENISDKISGMQGIFSLTEEARGALAAADVDIANVLSAMNMLQLEGETGLAKFSQMMANSDLTLAQIGTLSKALDDVDFANITDKAKVLSDIIEYGPDEAMKNFTESANANLSTTIQLSQKLIDTLSKVTFENLANSAKSLNSTYDSMQKVNDMISGKTEYDIAFMGEMLDSYPKLNEMIATGNQLTKAQMDEIAAAKRQEFEDDLTRKEAEIQLTIDNNNARIVLLEQMLTSAGDLEKMSLDMQYDLNEDGVVDLEELQNAYFANRTENDIKAYATAARKRLEIDLASADESKKADIQARLNAAKAVESSVSKFKLSDLGISTDGTKTGTDWASKINAEIQSILMNNENLQKQLTNINLIRQRLAASGSLSAQEETNAVEAYASKLNEIYILEQQLAVLENKLSQYQFEEEHAKSGQEWVEAIYSENAALEAQNSTLEDLTNAQKTAQQSLLNQVSGISKAYKIIDGRMVPVMSEYVKLSDSEREALDAATESYNDYSQSIDENTNKIDENTAAMEENLQKIEDKTVELYDTIAEAVKNSEEKKLKELQDSWSAEKELLDKRKAAYEKAFSEEDYNQSLEDLSKEREDIIKQLSNLEGATDLASTKKKEELLNKKAELDKQYNKNVTDYNREALLKSIDDQSTAIDNTQSEYEKAYEERINSVEWLENQVTTIVNQGLDATINYLKQNLPEYENAWSISKDNIVDGWTLLYDQVTTTVEAIENNIPDFSGMIAQLKEAATYSQTISSSLSNNQSSPPPAGTVTTYKATAGTVTAYKATDGKYYSTLEKAVSASVTQFIKSEYGDDPYMSASRLAAINAAKTGYNNSIKAESISSSIKVYAKGGLANSTGPAWLDGTPSKPERILSPIQTELFDKMIKNLEANNTSTTSNINDSISIGNITIQTPQLNTNADFGSAARTLAAELQAAITKRGININRKR